MESTGIIRLNLCDKVFALLCPHSKTGTNLVYKIAVKIKDNIYKLSISQSPQ